MGSGDSHTCGKEHACRAVHYIAMAKLISAYPYFEMSRLKGPSHSMAVQGTVQWAIASCREAVGDTAIKVSTRFQNIWAPLGGPERK